MRHHGLVALVLSTPALVVSALGAQQNPDVQPRPEETEVWEPIPQCYCHE